MLLEDIIANPDRALDYLERYVNDGSPSGFTEIHTTSWPTSPSSLNAKYRLSIVCGDAQSVRRFGRIPDVIGVRDQNSFVFVHPDMVEFLKLQGIESFEKYTHSDVIPTASSRTVRFDRRRPRDYVKLHYDKVIGRVNRALPFEKAKAGVEVSQLLKEAILGREVDQRLCILEELGARAFLTEGSAKSDNLDFSMVWRQSTPTGHLASEIAYVIPVFSLFSSDRLCTYHAPLLSQLVQRAETDPKMYVIEDIISMIVSCYVDLIVTLGLQPEWNAQNILIGFNSEFRPISVVMRDLADTEKDLDIRKNNGLRNVFESGAYKCISSDMPEYQIRHSFGYDFKIGTYVIKPLIDCLCYEYDLDLNEVNNGLRSFLGKITSRLPTTYFPDEHVWYKHDDIMLDASRPYIPISDPPYR